jgi:hypothetical protein
VESKKEYYSCPYSESSLYFSEYNDDEKNKLKNMKKNRNDFSSSIPFNTQLHVNTKEDAPSKNSVESKRKIMAVLSSSLVNLPTPPHIIVEQLKPRVLLKRPNIPIIKMKR